MMKKILLTLLLPLLGCLGLAAGDAFYNVRNYGAAGDGVQIDSPAINAAIEAAAEAGGGTVFFPAGTYLSYSLHLRDHITLHLDRGAVLKAAVPDEEHAYDPAEPNESTFQDFGHSHWQNSLIWGIGLHDVAIVGGGLIDGTGALSNGFGRQDRLANKAIALKECRDVTIRDIRLLQCGHFALLLTGVDNLTIHNVLADTNRDAFDIDCCANVKISDCQVNTLNDDAIVLKCSYALGYPKATENVTITNCQVSGYDPGTVFGGTFTKNITAATDRTHQAGNRVQRGIPQHHDLELHLRPLPRPGHRDRGRCGHRGSRREQHRDAGSLQFADLRAPGQPCPRAAGTAAFGHPPGPDLQCQRQGRGQPLCFDDLRPGGTLH